MIDLVKIARDRIEGHWARTGKRPTCLVMNEPTLIELKAQLQLYSYEMKTAESTPALLGYPVYVSHTLADIHAAG